MRRDTLLVTTAFVMVQMLMISTDAMAQASYRPGMLGGPDPRRLGNPHMMIPPRPQPAPAPRMPERPAVLPSPRSPVYAPPVVQPRQNVPGPVERPNQSLHLGGDAQVSPRTTIGGGVTVQPEMRGGQHDARLGEIQGGAAIRIAPNTSAQGQISIRPGDREVQGGVGLTREIP